MPDETKPVEPMVVKNENDAIRIVNSVGAVMSPLILAYIAAFGSPQKPEPKPDPVPAPVVVPVTADDLKKAFAEIREKISDDFAEALEDHLDKKVRK